MRVIILFIVLCFTVYNMPGQQRTERVEDRFIIKLEENKTLESWLQNFERSRSHFSEIKYIKTLFQKLNIHLFEIDESLSSFQDIKNSLEDMPAVAYVQGDYRVHIRNTPNDPWFSSQWALEIVKATDVWNITQGGMTIQEDEIVIAVVDDGFDPLHEDLIDNIWTNEGEVPNDGLDNDANGYVDDYFGLNVQTGRDNHPLLRHGTQTCGIIGARGDNGIGISGMNWNIKLMLISGIKFDSEIIEAYQYAMKEREAYNTSNGLEGSFVVGTNSSFGIDEESPDTHTSWCDAYDALGEVGILSVCSATNLGIDVDMQGDMPSNCDSPYLIAVTNTGQQDTKVNPSGFGSISIDLGAPGDDSFTTVLNDGYDNYGGTSASSPHVCGAVGLIYSTPCEEFIQFVKTNPSEAALNVKEAILNGVDQLPDLEGITVSGGRLNVYNSMLNVGEFCQASFGGLEITNILPNPNPDAKLTIRYQVPDIEEYEIVIYNSVGKIMYYETFFPPIFSEKQSILDIVDYPTGIYFVCLYGIDDKVCSSFVVL